MARAWVLIALFLLSQQVAAQANSAAATSTTNAGTSQTATSTGSQPASTTAGSSTAGSSTSGTSATSSTGTSNGSSGSSTGTSGASSTGTSAALSTGSSTQNPSSSTSTAPPLPTLSGVLPPPLIVPDTSNAPFMQKSNLPEGTVFIAVGAVLGFLGLCVLAWRGLIAWSLHRSVRRAAEAAYAPDAKSMFGFGPHAGYKSMYNESNMSLEQLSSTNTTYLGAGAGAGAGANQQRSSTYDRRASKQPRPASKAPAASSLFFSPTAGSGAGGVTASNRSSTFLPSGYYASGTAAPNAGQGVAHFGGSSPSGYGRVQSREGLTPPDSPSLRPQSSHLRPGSGHGQRQSTSRLSTGAAYGQQEQRKSRLSSQQGGLTIASPTQGRTPSKMFDDLLENHGHGPGERF